MATSLSQWPHDCALPLQGSARSVTCGSAVNVALGLDDKGRIAKVGIRTQACAIGQASAALFAQAVVGCNADSIGAALMSMNRWLKEGGKMPDWPGLATIAAARDYPARHGAILLAWEAALDALSTATKPG